MYILVYHCTLTNSQIYMNKNHIGALWSSIANYLSSKFQNQQHHWKPPRATLPILYQYPEHILEEATLSLQYLPIPLSPQHFLEEAQEPKLPQLLYHYDSCPYLTLHSTLYGRPRGPNTRGYSTTMISVHTSLSTALYMGGPEAQTPAGTLQPWYLSIPHFPQHFTWEAQKPKHPRVLYNYDICPYLTLPSTLYGRPRDMGSYHSCRVSGVFGPLGLPYKVL